MIFGVSAWSAMFFTLDNYRGNNTGSGGLFA
jgi:hypothetical protein